MSAQPTAAAGAAWADLRGAAAQAQDPPAVPQDGRPRLRLQVLLLPHPAEDLRAGVVEAVAVVVAVGRIDPPDRFKSLRRGLDNEASSFWFLNNLSFKESCRQAPAFETGRPGNRRIPDKN